MILALLACHGTADTPGKPEADDTGAPPLATPGPCADGSWMGGTAAAGLLFVDLTASPGGDGSFDHPFADLPLAVLAAETAGSATIALYPGSFPFGHAVHAAEGARIVVTGCPGETQITGGGKRPGFAMEGPGQVVLRNVTVRGGTPALAMRAGVEGLLEDVTITEGRKVGLQVAGKDTRATARRVTIGLTRGAGRGSPRGWSVSLADGSLALLDSTITGGDGYGLYAERGELVVQDTTIDGGGTAMIVGGIYGHAMDAVTLDGVTVRGVAGEGIGLYEVGTATLSSMSVETVVDSGIRGVGDGIVIRKGARPSSVIAVSDSVVSGAVRLGIVIDGGEATLSGLTADAGVMDGSASVWATAETTVTGTASVLDPAVYPLGSAIHEGEGPASFNRSRP